MYERANSSRDLVPAEFFTSRFTSRKAKAKPQRAMVEKLEERRLFNITGFQFNGPGSVQEGQVAGFQIYAATDHDWSGGEVHVNIGWGDGTGMQFDMNPSQQQNLYHLYPKASNDPKTATATVRDDAGDGTTYTFTSSSESMATDTYVFDAPMAQTDPLDTLVMDPIDTSDPTQTAPRAVARFFDGNPCADAGDFAVTSIDWGDGQVTFGGSIQKDVDGVNWDVLSFHDYGGPNPATSMFGDGTFPIVATVMDTNAASGSSSSTTVPATGKATVIAPNWLNATIGGVGTTPPSSSPGPVDKNNSVMTGTAGATTSLVFYVMEYAGTTNAPTPMSPSLITVTENPASTAHLAVAATVTKGPVATYTTAGAPASYQYCSVVCSVKGAVKGTVLSLNLLDPVTTARVTAKINF